MVYDVCSNGIFCVNLVSTMPADVLGSGVTRPSSAMILTI